MDATTLAVDLAKDVFEVAESRVPGTVHRQRRLTRRQFAALVESLDARSTVVMEACTTAHYWGRRCQARGAQVRLLPAQYVRPYVRRAKTDRTDAAALLEAARCAGLHPVPIKSVEQQTVQSLHRVRQQWQKTRVARMNLLRALLREQGITAPLGAVALRRRVLVYLEPSEAVSPLLARTLRRLLDELAALDADVRALDRDLTVLARQHPIARRLQEIPGVGPITATALIGSVGQMHAFRRSRAFASWLGLTPREYSSGATRRLGSISKQGDRYLRMLLAHGARAVLRTAPRHPASGLHQWGLAVAARRGAARAIIAMANKLARIIWAVWTRDQGFLTRAVAA